jgi:hypothetical protein
MTDQASTTWGVADDGSVVEVVVPAPQADLLDTRWPPLGLVRSTTAETPVTRRIELSIGHLPGVIATTVDGSLASGGWHRVESELALFAAERLARQVAVHSAVIVHEGIALIVPGASFVGKSTLCVVAAAAGLTVLSDEYALVDPGSGEVTGWPRPVRVRNSDGTLERLDLVTESDPVEVGLVALVGFQPGSGNDWHPISAAEVTVGLMANTVCARSRPDASLDAALSIARTAKAVGGVRGDAGEALRALITEMPG